MAGRYELTKSSKGQFHFSLKAGNGEKILSSEMYESKASAQKGIASVQTNCASAERYEKLEASNGKHYFTLKAANHQVIGTSQMYASAASRDAGIASVQANGATTEVSEPEA
jgi:uncharacterized protein YegP (UPF0339 family)